jgi:ribonuclease VapC
MVIDSSALIAILLNEPEAEQFKLAIDLDTVRLISTGTVLETAIVAQQRSGEAGTSELNSLLVRLPAQIVPFDLDQLTWARYALETYGRGRHPAKLNFGDCFPYALAKSTGEPLLFKGSDFSLTDLKSAV